MPPQTNTKRNSKIFLKEKENSEFRTTHKKIEIKNMKSNIANAEELRESAEKLQPIPLITNDALLNNPNRFNILLVLLLNGELFAKQLQLLLKMTSGNLDHHLKKLIEKGWVKERFVFGYRPLKKISLTVIGNEKFEEYANSLRNILNQIKDN